MITIPFLEYAAFTEDIVLDDISLRFSFFFNTRGQYWSMSISDMEDNILLSGIKLVIGFELIKDFSYVGLPLGKLYVVDDALGLNNIDQLDFTNERRLQLVYIPENELESF